jgi:hypothetical protein
VGACTCSSRSLCGGASAARGQAVRHSRSIRCICPTCRSRGEVGRNCAGGVIIFDVVVKGGGRKRRRWCCVMSCSSSNGRGRGCCRAKRNRYFICRWPLARTTLLVTRASSLCSAFLVEAQHPVKDQQPNTVRAAQHVLPCPHDIAPPAPPFKRLPACALALPVARAPLHCPLPAAHTHAIPHLERRLHPRLALRLLRSEVEGHARSRRGCCSYSWLHRGGGRGRRQRRR